MPEQLTRDEILKLIFAADVYADNDGIDSDDIYRIVRKFAANHGVTVDEARREATARMDVRHRAEHAVEEEAMRRQLGITPQ